MTADDANVELLPCPRQTWSELAGALLAIPGLFCYESRSEEAQACIDQMAHRVILRGITREVDRRASGWIPVSERLPKLEPAVEGRRAQYVVTGDDGDIWVSGAFDMPDGRVIFDHHHDRVVAWMLPAAYEPEGKK